VAELALSYVLPLRVDAPASELTPYLAGLAAGVDVVVVDGSASSIFALHHEWWRDIACHVPVDPQWLGGNGKVAAVHTGLERCRFDKVVIADDDVRYDWAALERMGRLLEDSEVVRPQNVFTEWPWHAIWDTGRTLLARISGGDWPGTLGVRREFLLRLGGYDGDVLFENLELVRTVRAGRGREVLALDLLVPRVPPSSTQFWHQRVRQAYDELARPGRMATQLCIAPMLCVGGRRVVVGVLLGALVAAEVGRRRAGGAACFPPVTTLAAPVWLVERAVTSWIALFSRVARGGVAYRGDRLARAASRPRDLRRRLGDHELDARQPPARTMIASAR
jgi:hypothetical protein